MSDSDHNNDDGKGFLARWSQRKQEAKQPEPKPDAADAEAAAPPPDVEGDAQPGAEQEFDLSSLPKLDELTGSTDITAFLRKGVPEHLRNEALRKSWALDPAIRNYVNPALEYAYDWNTPGGVPGGGELGAGVDVARMVLQIMGDLPTGEAATTAAETAKAPAAAPESSAPPEAVQKPEPELPVQPLQLGNEAVSDTPDGGAVAEPAPKSDASESAAPQQPVRRHGSAKPTV